MAERDAFLVPTLVTYDAMERRGAELGLAPVAQAKNREVLDAGRTAIRLAREAGVRIGFRTDLMGSLDDEQLHGLRLQAEVEGPLALLRAATSVNAELLGRDDLGRIGPGAVADLLVLDADPLRDPSVLWGDPNRRAVYQGEVAEQGARLVLLPRTAGWRAHPAAATGVAARVRCVSGELLTIASLNTRGIPLTGSQLAERYAVIGAGFDAGDADAVCCQEVFTYWHLRLLVRRMRSFRQVSYWRAPAGPAGGLVTFSRRPVSGTAYRRFGRPPRAPGVPWASRFQASLKGALVTRLARPGLCVINTHPVANHDGDWSKPNRFYPLHRAQFAVFAQVVNEAGPRAVICGDFNIARESPLFGDFMAATGLADAFRGACPPTFRAEYLPAGATPHCIDFILTAGEVTAENTALVFAEKEPLGYVSDHIGLRARLSLTPTG